MRFKQRSSSDIFVYSYFVLITSLILINALSVLELFSDDILNLSRGMIHVIPLLCLSILYLHNKPENYYCSKKFFAIRFYVAFIMSMLMLLSNMVNGLEKENFMRLVLLLLHLINISVILPMCLSYVDPGKSIHKLSKLYIWLIIILSVYVLFNYANAVGYHRLGYPFIPGVYAYFCVIALAVSLMMLNSNYLAVFFLAMIFLSGSRSALLLGFAAYLINYFNAFSFKNFTIFVVILASILFVFFAYEDISRPFIAERDDYSSGRIQIWVVAVEKISESPLLGYSSSMTFSGIKEGEDLAAHNSFFDLSIRYGIIFGVIAYVFWFTYLPGLRSKKISRKLSLFGLTLFFLIITKSTVTNIFWTNMGDGASYLVTVIIAMIVYMSVSRVRS